MLYTDYSKSETIKQVRSFLFFKEWGLSWNHVESGFEQYNSNSWEIWNIPNTMKLDNIHFKLKYSQTFMYMHALFNTSADPHVYSMSMHILHACIEGIVHH